MYCRVNADDTGNTAEQQIYQIYLSSGSQPLTIIDLGKTIKQTTPTPTEKHEQGNSVETLTVTGMHCFSGRLICCYVIITFL